MRICSFLPSATEILCALGLTDSVAGVTYECDYPPEVCEKPVVVHSRLPHLANAGDIDRTVRDFLARGESLYQVDVEKLRQIHPDLIVTQDLCHVCAASPGDLASALSVLESVPAVLTLNPNTISDVWRDIELVGNATGGSREATALVSELKRRVLAVEKAVSGKSRPRVLCLEWLDPPFVAGHWVPEMVSRAGGIDVLGRVAEPGFRVDWEAVLRTEAEFVVIMPCGYGLEQTIQELTTMRFPNGWEKLPAVRRGQVFAVDASSYFSRPGPRLATGVEILAHLFHPERTPVSPPAGSVLPWTQASAATNPK